MKAEMYFGAVIALITIIAVVILRLIPSADRRIPSIRHERSRVSTVSRSSVAAEVISVLQARANQYQGWSRWTLISTVVLVFIGLLVFLGGDRLVDAVAPKEDELAVAIDRVDRELTKLADEESQVEARSALANELSLLWEII